MSVKQFFIQQTQRALYILAGSMVGALIPFVVASVNSIGYPATGDLFGIFLILEGTAVLAATYFFMVSMLVFLLALYLAPKLSLNPLVLAGGGAIFSLLCIYGSSLYPSWLSSLTKMHDSSSGIALLLFPVFVNLLAFKIYSLDIRHKK